MSRAEHPKQFHDVLGTGKTLIQQTFDRFAPICPPENIFIVTNENYKELVMEQLPAINADQVLLEPMMRNTAPCIAYACHKIAARDPEAAVVVAPSDHLIFNEEEYIHTLEVALEQARSKNCLVTLGIKPTRADTGYGYIQFDEEEGTVHENVKRVKTFTEKPDLDLALKFLNSGDFYWNSGMFIWTIESILSAFQTHLSDVDEPFREGASVYNTDKEADYINEIYPSCPNISIDYGIMEKAENVYVVLSDFGWSDIGTWGSLYTHIEKDDDHNAIVGDKVRVYDSSDNIVFVPKDKRVVLQGLEGYIVVEANDTLLVCRKEDEQLIKKFVGDIKKEG